MQHNKLKNKLKRETKLQIDGLRRKLSKSRKWWRVPVLNEDTQSSYKVR